MYKDDLRFSMIFQFANCEITKGYVFKWLSRIRPRDLPQELRTTVNDGQDIPRMIRITIWLVAYLLLWKIWVRQLGWWHSKYMESHKSHVPNHQPVLFDYFKIYFSHHLDSHGLSSNHFKHNKQQITAIAPSNGQRKNEEQRSLQLGHLKLNQLL